jgi:hypothetical protein
MKLSKDKRSTVEFQIEIEGTSEKITPRLVLKSKDLSLIYEGRMNGKNATFEVSKLDRMFEGVKETEAEIEVIVEGKYFTPWKSVIEFESPVTVTVTESLHPKVKEPTVRIEAKPKQPARTTKPVIKEGQRKIKINGQIVEVLITKISTESGKTVLRVIDENGNNRIVKLK